MTPGRGVIVSGAELKDRLRRANAVKVVGDGGYWFMGSVSDDNDVLLTEDSEYQDPDGCWHSLASLFHDKLGITVF